MSWIEHVLIIAFIIVIVYKAGYDCHVEDPQGETVWLIPKWLQFLIRRPNGSNRYRATGVVIQLIAIVGIVLVLTTWAWGIPFGSRRGISSGIAGATVFTFYVFVKIVVRCTSGRRR